MKIPEDIDIYKMLKKIDEKLDSIVISSREWFSLEQVADYIDMSENTVYCYVNQGKIPYHKIPNGRKLIFKRQEIDDWIEGKNEEIREKEVVKIASDIWEKVNH